MQTSNHRKLLYKNRPTNNDNGTIHQQQWSNTEFWFSFDASLLLTQSIMRFLFRLLYFHVLLHMYPYHSTSKSGFSFTTVITIFEKHKTTPKNKKIQQNCSYKKIMKFVLDFGDIESVWFYVARFMLDKK